MSYKYLGGKNRRWEKLSRDEQADLLFDLLQAFTLLKNLPDAVSFITDLLTSSEVKLLSKRLRIAKLLLSGKTYLQIKESLKVSESTIAKVAVWLQEKGEGFRKVVEKIPQRKKVKPAESFSAWEKYKGTNIGAVWESLLGDGQKLAAKNEEKELRSTLDALSSKDVVRHRVDEFYKENIRDKKKR